jgi:uncharacterized protein YuzE
VRISLAELREVLRTHPRWTEWDDGDAEAVYLRLGSAERKGLRAETRKRGDELDLVLEIDAQGRVQGIEFW